MRILAMIDAHDLHARRSVPPHHPARRHLLPFSSSFLLRALAPYTHRRGRTPHTSTLFHFRCATQLSNAPCAEFSACRNLDGYEAAAWILMM
jgi:hypothetical protein